MHGILVSETVDLSTLVPGYHEELVVVRIELHHGCRRVRFGTEQEDDISPVVVLNLSAIRTR